jgi:hypothetical protein
MFTNVCQEKAFPQNGVFLLGAKHLADKNN